MPTPGKPVGTATLVGESRNNDRQHLHQGQRQPMRYMCWQSRTDANPPFLVVLTAPFAGCSFALGRLLELDGMFLLYQVIFLAITTQSLRLRAILPIRAILCDPQTGGRFGEFVRNNASRQFLVRMDTVVLIGSEKHQQRRHRSKGGYRCGAQASMSAGTIVFRSAKENPFAERKPTMACYPRNASSEPCPSEPTVGHENATNEPAVGHENATNEPTVGHENATNEPTAVATSPAKMRRTNPNCRAARRLCGTRRNEAIFAIRSPEHVPCQRDRATGDFCETKPIIKWGDCIMDAGRRQNAPNEPTGRTVATGAIAPNEPTSLGPGLRNVSGASGHRSMFVAGSANRNEFFSSIDAQFPPLSAASRLGGAPHVFRAWHRPHNTATRRGGQRRFTAYSVRVTAIHQSFRRKCQFRSDYRHESQADRGQGQGPNSGAFRVSASGRKRYQNTAIYCHFFGVDCGRAAGGQGVRPEPKCWSRSTSRIKKTAGQAAGCRQNPDLNLNLNLARNPLPNRNLTPNLNLAFGVLRNEPGSGKRGRTNPPDDRAKCENGPGRTVPPSEA